MTPGSKDRKFLAVLIGLTLILAALPYVIGLLSTPRGGMYLGYQYNTDDHMVYSAWMRQAMDGRFLMDNRFTIDQQPSLTINVYYFCLGLVAKLTGIPLAATLARLFFSALFIVLAYRLITRLGWDGVTSKLALVFTIIGGGIGFLVWHTFGELIVRPVPEVLATMLGGRLPVDVWQPEGFVFPSMLTNGLFMVSLCLIVYVMQCILNAKESWQPVLPGAAAMCVLMNIHSYDVLIVALVMAGFLAATFVQRAVTWQWCARAAAIGAGAVPSALWFVHVLRADTVFQARANTDTPSANFQAVLFGYILMMIPALAGLALRKTEDAAVRNRLVAGAGLAALLFVGMYVAAGGSKEKYFLDLSGWVLVTLLAGAATALLSDENPFMNLLISWALVGTVAVYFPGQFQRKLAMGLSVPWAILAAYGVQTALAKQEGSIRRLGTVLAAILLGATSLRWLTRELEFIKTNTSRTSLQTVYLDPDETKIMAYLNDLRGRQILIAPPGIQSPAFNKNGDQEGGQYATAPLLPDLNPIASGLTGVYTYAGHWSETPNYEKRRSLLYAIYYGTSDMAKRAAYVNMTHANYMIVPGSGRPSILNEPDLSKLGEVVVPGSTFELIRVPRSPEQAPELGSH